MSKMLEMHLGVYATKW